MRYPVRVALTWVSVTLIALACALPALADSEAEPPTPLHASTVDLIVIGIVVAAVVVLAWLGLYRLAEARKAKRRRASDEGES